MDIARLAQVIISFASDPLLIVAVELQLAYIIACLVMNDSSMVFFLSLAGGKCSQLAELSGENINITYKPDGTHIAVGNRVNCFYLSSSDTVE